MVDAHAFLLLSSGFHHGPVGLDRRLIEEAVFLLLPNEPASKFNAMFST